mmetsp:Transcript_94088/g.269378  ORF Transcript_94088/g.269378 Transcript_94088/m.269378 type:complete len:213 (-) Transcript_94088:820-1458(-)
MLNGHANIVHQTLRSDIPIGLDHNRHVLHLGLDVDPVGLHVPRTKPLGHLGLQRICWTVLASRRDLCHDLIKCLVKVTKPELVYQVEHVLIGSERIRFFDEDVLKFRRQIFGKISDDAQSDLVDRVDDAGKAWHKLFDYHTADISRGLDNLRAAILDSRPPALHVVRHEGVERLRVVEARQLPASQVRHVLRQRLGERWVLEGRSAGCHRPF